MPRIWALIWCLAMPPLEAAVYRCEVAGQLVYTDKPCAAGVAPHAMPGLSTVPSGADADLAKQYDQRRQQDLTDKRKDDAEWLKAYEMRRAEDERMGAAAAEGRVLKDMSADQVRRALGGPDEVARSADGEEWIYGSGKTRQAIVFKQGRVVRISGKKK